MNITTQLYEAAEKLLCYVQETAATAEHIKRLAEAVAAYESLPVVDEREGFERWVRSTGAKIDLAWTDTPVSTYLKVETRGMLAAWKARAALSPTVSTDEPFAFAQIELHDGQPYVVFEVGPDELGNVYPVGTKFYADRAPAVVKQNVTTGADVCFSPDRQRLLKSALTQAGIGFDGTIEGCIPEFVEELCAFVLRGRDAAQATDKDCLTVAGDEDDCPLLRLLDSFQTAYSEEFFAPLTDDERAAHAGTGIIDRASAGMGRHLAKFMAQAAAEIRRLRATPPQPVSNSYTLPVGAARPLALRVRFPWAPEWHYVATDKAGAELDAVVQFHAAAGNVAEPLYAAPPADAPRVEALPPSLMPDRPEPEIAARANQYGVPFDGYTGAQMIRYGRACADAQLRLSIAAIPARSPTQSDLDAARIDRSLAEWDAKFGRSNCANPVATADARDAEVELARSALRRRGIECTHYSLSDAKEFRDAASARAMGAKDGQS